MSDFTEGEIPPYFVMDFFTDSSPDATDIIDITFSACWCGFGSVVLHWACRELVKQYSERGELG